MADSIILPGARVRFANPDGTCTAEFYRYLQRVASAKSVSEVTTSVTNITQIIEGGAFLPASTKLLATDGIASVGTLSSGFMQINLEDVTQTVGGTIQRVTIDGKGRVTQSGAATTDNLTEGVANLYFTPARVNSSLAGGDGITLSFISGVTTITLTGLPVFLLSQIGDQLTDQAGNPLIGNQTTALPVDWPDITSKPTSVSGYGITDAQVIGTPVKLPRYTFAGKPSAVTYIDTLIIISDLSGGPGPCWSNGTNWLLVGSNAIASP